MIIFSVDSSTQVQFSSTVVTLLSSANSVEPNDSSSRIHKPAMVDGFHAAVSSTPEYDVLSLTSCIVVKS